MVLLYTFHPNGGIYHTGKGCDIHPSAVIGDGVIIGDNVTIGPNSVIYSKTEIGSGTRIDANCTIGTEGMMWVWDGDSKVFLKQLGGVKIGKNCIIHAGVVIGSDGFGFAPDDNGVYKKVPQIGDVVIEDDVEIGANTTIDRATMGSTYIRKGVKIDNLCQIAHNVEVGEHTAMASQVGIAGSAKIGKRVIIGGQAGIGGHLSIADQTQIAGQSGVASTIKTAQAMMGSPVIEPPPISQTRP